MQNPEVRLKPTDKGEEASASDARALTYKESPDAWQTKVHVQFGLPFPLPWMLIASILFTVGYVISRFFNESFDTIRAFAVYSALIAAIANSVVYYERLLDDIADTFPLLLDESSERSAKWIAHWYHNVFWSNKNIIMGGVLGLLCLVAAIDSSVDIFHSTPGKIYMCIISSVIGFLGGSMFWTMLGIAGMTSSLGKDVKIRPSIFDTRTSVLRTASSLVWKVSITAVLVYLLGMSVFLVADIQLNIWMLILPLVFGIFIILYFILPQVNIHKTLVHTKRVRLKALVKQLDHTFDNVSSNPTPENINQLRDLFHLQDIVNKKKSWSFGIGELLMLLGSVLLPLIFFVVDHIVRR